MSTPNEKKDLLIMKLLHYFITERNYNPVVVHGIQNEIWLENMNEEFKIVRIVMSYIHNKEQLEFDDFKVNRLTRQIKLKTLTFKMKTLSLYLDLNSDVELLDSKNNYHINLENEKVLKNNEIIKKYYGDITQKLKCTEEGELLYKRINNDILKKNLDESEKLNDLFSPKKPIVTYILLGIITIVMLLMYFFGNGSLDIKTLYKFGALVKDNNMLRIVSSIFIHIGIIHYFMNAWALKLLGEQTEKFYGHIKMFIIFLYSGVIGNLLSIILMNKNSISAGASGAIFGLMSSILYFALNQRTYMAEALKREILPVIIINTLLGFVLNGINIFAHIGGLIGGFLISSAVGVKYKTSKFERINSIICSIILLLLLTYLGYFC